jgi:hypothetical protein
MVENALYWHRSCLFAVDMTANRLSQGNVRCFVILLFQWSIATVSLLQKIIMQAWSGSFFLKIFWHCQSVLEGQLQCNFDFMLNSNFCFCLFLFCFVNKATSRGKGWVTVPQCVQHATSLLSRSAACVSQRQHVTLQWQPNKKWALMICINHNPRFVNIDWNAHQLGAYVFFRTDINRGRAGLVCRFAPGHPQVHRRTALCVRWVWVTSAAYAAADTWRMLGKPR